MNFINLQRVIDKTTLARGTLYAYIKAGKFPASVQLGPRRVGWVESEVDAWIKGQVDASRPAKLEGSVE